MKQLVMFLSIFALVSLLSSLSMAQSTPEQEKGTRINNTSRSTTIATPLSRSVIDINNLWLPVRNDGVLARDSLSAQELTYPKQYGNVLYTDYFMWAGKVNDGQSPAIRTGGGYYNAIGNLPGSIISKGIAEDPSSPAVRVYRIRPDYLTADLTLDAAAFYNLPLTSVTAEMVAAVRDQYAKDWSEWPWRKGAPFLDINGNGIMDSGETPGIQNADQVAWFAYNDLDDAQCKSFAGFPSMGLEVQTTIWAYKAQPLLQDIIFKRYRIVYKGTSLTPPGSTIDSMYVCQWADPDIGNSADDYGGCDSVLGLGYAYNSRTPDVVYHQLGLTTPGLGYILLQGPLVPGKETDQGVFDFSMRQGKRNLPMTSFFLRCVSDGLSAPTTGRQTYYYWNIMKGHVPYPDDQSNSRTWVDLQGRPTKFTYSGDPISRSGWIDGLGRNWGTWPSTYGFSAVPSDVRFFLNSGPFTMALGDTQEVVLAIMASQGADGPNNVGYLKYIAATLRGIYPSLGEYVSGLTTGVVRHPGIPENFTLEQNYPNPFNPSTSIKYSLPKDATVRLAVYDLLGREARVLRDGNQHAGEYSLNWDGRDAMGYALPSGVYFYRLEAGEVRMTRKLMLMH